MTIVQAIILGIVQGLTEFLPISSSGHLLIVPWLFNWHFLLENPDLNKTFDVALHFGTFISLVVYFWRDIGRLLAAWARTIANRRLDSTDGKLAWLIIVSMVPAAIVGVLFEDVIVEVLGKPWMLAMLMIGFGGVMWAADRYARHEREMEDLSWRDALLIGGAQALALSPGVSRSGVTMVTGLFLRLDREAAARFSFLMSIPIDRRRRSVQGPGGRARRAAPGHGGPVPRRHGRRGASAASPPSGSCSPTCAGTTSPSSSSTDSRSAQGMIILDRRPACARAWASDSYRIGSPTAHGHSTRSPRCVTSPAATAAKKSSTSRPACAGRASSWAGKAWTASSVPTRRAPSSRSSRSAGCLPTAASAPTPGARSSKRATRSATVCSIFASRRSAATTSSNCRSS